MKKLLMSFFFVVMALGFLVANTTSANTTMTKATESQNLVIMQTNSAADAMQWTNNPMELIYPPSPFAVAENTQEQSQMPIARVQWRSSSSFSMTSSNNGDVKGNKMQVRGAENLILPMFAISMSISGQTFSPIRDDDALHTSLSGETFSLNTMNVTVTG